MKIFQVKLIREMQITVNVTDAATQEKAESIAIGRAEAVGYTNLDPSVTVWLEPEVTADSIEEI